MAAMIAVDLLVAVQHVNGQIGQVAAMAPNSLTITAWLIYDWRLTIQ
jgi:hypothetical protein